MYPPYPFKIEAKKAAYPSNKAAFIQLPKPAHYNQKSKLLPPYGKALFANLQKGVRPKNNIFLLLGALAWKSAKIFSKSQTVLVLPDGSSPYDYYWPVRGCSVLALDKGVVCPQRIEETAHALLLSGASCVHVILSNYKLVIYRRG